MSNSEQRKFSYRLRKDCNRGAGDSEEKPRRKRGEDRKRRR
jgi:hypothetical protein